MLLASLALAIGIATSGPIKIVGPDQVAGAAEPQIAVDEVGNVFVVFGAADKIYLSRSTDKGATFNPPVAIASAPNLALGKRRGPRVSTCSGNVVVTAVSDGNLLAWSSADAGQMWTSSAAQINDTPNSAAEGLDSIAGNGSEMVSVWLDSRDKGAEVYASVSQDGGQNWGANTLVYKAPGGSVCDCCQPSVSIAADGAIHVMFRNNLNGNRDMYLSNSTDDGSTWSTAALLGTGHWKLDACPMDGGAISVDDDGTVFTLWRRDDSVFKARPGGAEDKLGIGQQPWIYGRQGVYGVYLKRRPGPLMMFKGGEPPRSIAPDADDPVVAGPATGDGPVIATWVTSKGEIMAQVLDS